MEKSMTIIEFFKVLGMAKILMYVKSHQAPYIV